MGKIEEKPECPEGARLIPLTRGKYAIVDAEDYDWLMKWKWYAHKNRHTYYARRAQRMGNKHIAILMHREILNVPQGMETDHINHNGLDNRVGNLRSVTRAQNQWNSRKQYRGVTWCKRDRKWYAQIWHNAKRLHLGSYLHKQDAKQAYLKAKCLLRGNDIQEHRPFQEIPWKAFKSSAQGNLAALQSYRKSQTRAKSGNAVSEPLFSQGDAR